MVLRAPPACATLAAMTIELEILAWGCILGIVHIFIAVRFKTRQYGTKWNMGARDEELPPASPVVGRLARAQANFFETFPIAAAGLIIVSVADLDQLVDDDRRLALARRPDPLSAALRLRRAGRSNPGVHRQHGRDRPCPAARSGRLARLR